MNSDDNLGKEARNTLQRTASNENPAKGVKSRADRAALQSCSKPR